MDDLAYPFEMEVAGRQLFFERTLDLARRVESVTGPIYPFAERLERGNVTTTEVARIYGALVRTDPDGPTAEDIDKWISRVGIFCHRRLAVFLTQLIVGSENLARESQRLADPKKKDDTRGPLERTGASIGNS